MRTEPQTSATVRVRLDITGVVQGVGFRPSVARIAAHHGVSGFVFNDSGAVHCELQGPPDAVQAALTDLRAHPPPMARIDELRSAAVTVRGDEKDFTIVDSAHDEGARTLVPPDIALCADCLREMRDPANRRFEHPFITCTNCGPRYTVITDLPYDRPATTMARFDMCPACAAEYHDPLDRRYHAQTIACPDCGPRLDWQGPGDGAHPLEAAVRALDDGLIVAVKGVGGYHLACRADDDTVLTRLRTRKSRPAKPFALMVGDVAAAGEVAEVSSAAAAMLTSAAAPIVLMPRRGHPVVQAVAPHSGDLGVMLAYSPVHHLLFSRLGSVPLVMTSANLGGSPIVFRDCDIGLLAGLADGVLGHDRPIHVPCEDSVVTVDAHGDVVPIRRSRGYAPLPVSVPRAGSGPVILATGGDLKTTFCLMASDGRAHMSSHLGDMADPRTQAGFDAVLRHLVHMTDRRPDVIACDQHPGYATTSWAQRQQLRTVRIQHHHAHAVSLLAEHNRLGTPTVVAAYDGTGYGTDGTIWGGELLAISDPARFTRVGHLATFGLPGGEGAIRQPARIALELLHRAGVEWSADLPPVKEVGRNGEHILRQQIPRGIGCTPTTSMGRLFDAVASLLGVCQAVTYEGQAATELEHVARAGCPVPLPAVVNGGVIETVPMIRGLAEGMRRKVPVADLAAGFHQAAIGATVIAVSRCARARAITTVGLTGGVFVNHLLLDGVRKKLTDNGFEVLVHQVLPCNDGGLALGQAVAAAASNAGDNDRSNTCVSVSPAR